MSAMLRTIGGLRACRVLLFLALASPAAAQEPIHSPAAMQPSAGALLLRGQLTYLSLEDNRSAAAAGGLGGGGGADVDEWRAVTRLSYGLTGDLALTLDVPLVHRNLRGGAAAAGGGDAHGGGDGESHGGGPLHGVGGQPLGGDRSVPRPAPAAADVHDAGVHEGHDVGLAVDDVTIGLKVRLFKHDSGPTDTTRASLILGLEVPTGTGGLSSHSWDPLVGVAVTSIRGRHGFDGAIRWKFNTGSGDETRHLPTLPGMGFADALLYDAAYLFRLHPASFGPSSTAAAHLVLEATGAYETNGDNELLVGPGLVIEWRNVAAECSIQLPVWQDVDYRPETRFAVTVGVRFLF